MAAAAGMPEHEMAAAVLRQESLTGPELAEPDRGPRLADDPAAVVAAERARDGAELVGALAEQLRPRFGAVAVAVWLLDADGALEMLGADGLGGTESSRWRRLPPQFDCAEQRVAFTGDDLWGLTGPPPETGRLPAIAPWGRAAARAVLALRHRSGARLGVAEVWWQAPHDDFDAAARARLSAVVAGFAEVLGVRMANETVGSTAPSPGVFRLLDEIADSVLILRPLRDESGALADFAMMHKSPGYVDPAGRRPAELAGLTLLEAYPSSGSPDGLFARASRVLATGRAEHVPGASTAPLTGGKDAVGVADLRVAPFFAGVICTWRKLGEPERLADLLGNAQRLGRIGGWDENLTTGTVRWTRRRVRPVRARPGAGRPDPHRRPAQLRHRGGPGRRPAVPAGAAADQGTRRRGVPHRPARRHGGQADPRLRRAGPRRRGRGGAARRVPGRVRALPDPGGAGRDPRPARRQRAARRGGTPARVPAAARDHAAGRAAGGRGGRGRRGALPPGGVRAAWWAGTGTTRCCCRARTCCSWWATSPVTASTR